MQRALLILKDAAEKDRALRILADALPMSRVEFKGPRRTLPQNDRMWAMLTDVSRQLSYDGSRLTADDWKILFLDDLKREYRTVPSLDGKGFVRLGGRSSSDLSKEEMTDLIELIFKWGEQFGVEWSDPESQRLASLGEKVS